MWTTFFRDGGWGMYPTSLFGFFLVMCAVLCVIRPERRFVPLLACLAVMTACAGVLGCCVGMVTTFHFLPRVALEQRLTIAALGCAESLNNVVLAMMLVVLSALISAVAAARAALVRAPASDA